MTSACSGSSIPAAVNSSRASVRLNRRSAGRSSVSSPSSRSRCSPSRTSCRVASTNRSSSGARSTSSPAAPAAAVCPLNPARADRRSPARTRSSSGARSLSSRSTIAHPSSSGAAVSSRTSADPGAVWRSAPSTDSQKCCGSRSSGRADTHATRSARAAPLIHDRSKIVLPLPAGAEVTATRADIWSRSNRTGRETTTPAPGPAVRPVVKSGSSTGSTARSSHGLIADGNHQN